MSKYIVMFCVDEVNSIVSLDNCRRVILYDIVSKSVVEIIEFSNEFNIDLLEQYIDKHDPYLLFTCSSNNELIDLVEETGVHVYVVDCPINYSELLSRI